MLFITMMHVFPAALLTLTMGSAIMIDGQFEDWPMNETPDGWHVESASDKESIYLRISHPGPPRVIQHLEEPLQIALDLDGDLQTGCTTENLMGCELAFEMSPETNGRISGGVTARSWQETDTWKKRSPYEYGFVMAPTTASRQHEIRLDRATLPPVRQPMRVVLQSGDSDPVITEPKHRSVSATRSKRNRIPKAKPNTIRVVSWNIEYGGLLKRAETVTALLKQLEPDVLLIQELEDDQGVQVVKNLLDSLNDDDTWTVSMSPKGSGLRCAVASRIKSTSLEAFDRVTRSDSPKRIIRVAGLLIEDENAPPFMAISLHLKCCGDLNGREDMTRISETLSIREAIYEAATEHQPSGLVIGGDFNLVASPVPLEILQLDGESMLGKSHEGDLLITNPFHLDGRDNYTWYNPGSAFTPGRLDYILIGGNLKTSDAFVLDSTDLGNHVPDLSKNSTDEASDHLPVVIDVTPTNPGD